MRIDPLEVRTRGTLDLRGLLDLDEQVTKTSPHPSHVGSSLWVVPQRVLEEVQTR